MTIRTKTLLGRTAATHTFSRADYFRRPIYSSLSFWLATAVMLADEFFGAYILLSRLESLSWIARNLILLVLFGALPLVWVRTIIDHRTMKQLYPQTPTTQETEVLRMSAHYAEFYPFYTFFSVLLLLFALLVTLSHHGSAVLGTRTWAPFPCTFFGSLYE
jgi:hypothetical protein